MYIIVNIERITEISRKACKCCQKTAQTIPWIDIRHFKISAKWIPLHVRRFPSLSAALTTVG